MANDEKAKLYREIVALGDETSILHRMRLLGFWPPNQGLPSEPRAEAQERARIEAEMAKLHREQSRVRDPEKALAQERKRRWEESKERRKQRKKERLLQLQQRQNNWAAQQAASISHLGEGVSAGLQQTTSNQELLQSRDLPLLQTGPEIAAVMGITLKTLRWLTYHRRRAALVHYHRYGIAKKTGGIRFISAPKPALRAAQEWIFHEILGRVEVEPTAHGFVPGRSVLSNALPHVGKAVVINLDLKDFFPSITFRRVKGLFHKLGYSEQAATIFALLCTEPPRLATELDGKVYHVALGQRVLPQGACTSPSITNLLCRRLDRRLVALAQKHEFVYTRYADDLTFSGEHPQRIGRLIRSVRSILESEGFVVHPTKTRIMRRNQRQEVTGITVNDRPAVSRKEVRKLRAILHNIARHGWESQNRSEHPDFEAHLRGRVGFVCMIDPQRGAPLQQALERALQPPSHRSTD